MKLLLSIFILISSIFSCSSRHGKYLTQLVSELVGQEIIIPDSINFILSGKDSISHSFSENTYKIVLYMDSSGCTSCKLRLHDWKDLKRQTDKLENQSLEYIFFLQPQNISEIKRLIKREKLDIFVCIDSENTFYTINNLPVDSRYHCFLLNKQNKIELVGNPIVNNEIKNLYINQIMKNNK